MDPLRQVTDEEIISACGEEPSAVCEWVFERTSNELFANASDWLIARPLKILLILVLAWLVNRLLRRAIRRFTDRVANTDVAMRGRMQRYTPNMLLATSQVSLRSASRAETLGGVLRSVSTAVIWTLAVLMILGELGINLAPLIAGAGVAGVALGFGAQTVVRDFLSGIFMLMEDQYGLGDLIDVGEAIGVVEAVSLRTTRLRGIDGSVWHVPNGTIARVGNMSQDWSRAIIDVDVAYATDLAHAKAVILRVTNEMRHDPDWTAKILEEPEVWGVERLASDGVALRLTVKTKPGEQFMLMRDLRIRIKDALEAEGIEIPFPQRSVWIREQPAEQAFALGEPVTAVPAEESSEDRGRRGGRDPGGGAAGR